MDFHQKPVGPIIDFLVHGQFQKYLNSPSHPETALIERKMYLKQIGHEQTIYNLSGLGYLLEIHFSSNLPVRTGIFENEYLVISEIISQKVHLRGN